jgi:hypothetical protein
MISGLREGAAMSLAGPLRTSPVRRSIAVRQRTHDRLGADIAGAARPVLNDKLLAKQLGQSLTDQARFEV